MFEGGGVFGVAVAESFGFVVVPEGEGVAAERECDVEDAGGGYWWWFVSGEQVAEDGFEFVFGEGCVGGGKDDVGVCGSGHGFYGVALGRSWWRAGCGRCSVVS